MPQAACPFCGDRASLPICDHLFSCGTPMWEATRPHQGLHCQFRESILKLAIKWESDSKCSNDCAEELRILLMNQ